MKVEIENLLFKCIIGILDFERVKKQRVLVNLSFEYEFTNNSFVDYSQVVNLIKHTMKKEKFKLLEDAIIHIEELLKQTYPIKNINLKIAKPDIIKDCMVSLSS